MTRGRVRTFPPAALTLALRSTLTLEAAANEVGCTSAALQAAAKQLPEVRAAIADQAHARENKLADALLKHRGILSIVAREVGLGSAAAVRYHVARSLRLKQIFDDTRERIVDIAELNVFRAVEQGSVEDSWKLLKTLGKDRGYTERREVAGTIEHNVTHTPSASLIDLLDRLASSDPDAVEAEFAILPEEERSLLKAALARRAAEPAQLEAAQYHLGIDLAGEGCEQTLYQDVSEFEQRERALG